jgi:hypothetical protein
MQLNGSLIGQHTCDGELYAVFLWKVGKGLIASKAESENI